MRFIIVTGMSGAGKSAVVDALEDVGVYCVDNIPPALIPKFAYLGSSGTDSSGMRGENFIKELTGALAELDRERVSYQILFLDAANDELINRYKITRRPHPLMREGGSLAKAISRERELLSPVKDRADMVIDTTLLSASQLRSHIHDLFRSDDNPFYDPQLRPMTGLDQPVRDYVLRSPKTQGFLTRFYDFIDYMIPLYRHDEQKSQLIIAVGCTGGKHRSVTIARELANHLSAKGLRVITTHRDIEKKKL